MGGIVEIAWHVVVEDSHVARALHIGLAPQRVDTAPRLANVAQQELQDRKPTNSLHTGCVLGHSERIQDGSGPILGHSFSNLLDLCCRDAGDALSGLERVPRNELLEAREDAVQIIQTAGNPWVTAAVELVAPSLCIVLVLLFVKAAKQPTLEIECGIAKEKGVG